MRNLLSQPDFFVVVCVTAAMLFVRSSLVLIPGLALTALPRRHGAAMRSALFRATLAAVALTPIAAISFRALGLHSIWFAIPIPAILENPARQLSVDPSKGAAIDTPALRPTMPVPEAARRVSSSLPNMARMPAVNNTPTPPSPNSQSRPTRQASIIYTVLGFLWIAMAALLMARLLIANLLVAATRRNSVPAPRHIDRTAAHWASLLAVRPPVVRLSSRVNSPCLVGWLRPMILLPAEDADEAESEVLLHEMAHVARRDCPWQLLGRIIAAILWFHPLVWLLLRGMEHSAEEACDDIVLVHGGDRAAYARQLLELAQKAQVIPSKWNAGVGVITHKSGIGRRVARMLDVSHAPGRAMSKSARWSLLAYAGLLGVTVAIVRPGDAAPATTQPATATWKFNGRVVSSDGNPVKDAILNLDRAAPFAGLESIGSTKTDNNGRFTLEIPALEVDPTRPIELLIRAPGQALRAYRVAPGKSEELRLDPPTRVTVTVSDSDGKPIQGLRVVPVSFVDPLSLLSRRADWYFRLPDVVADSLAQITDAQGAVRFENLPGGMRMVIAVRGGSYANPGIADRVGLAGDPQSPPATIRLAPGCSISGRAIYGPSGAAAPGIHVAVQSTLRGGSGSGMAITDKDGNFQLTNLPSGIYNVQLYPSEEVVKDWTAVAHEDVRLVEASNITGVDFALIHGALVRGKVTGADTGEPLVAKDFRVGAQGPAHPRSGGAVQSTLVGLDGSYSLRVPPGKQFIFVQGPIPEPYVNRQQPSREITVSEGETVTVDFPLQRRPGKPVAGTVVDMEGKPVAGAFVTAESRDRGTFSAPAAKTADNGSFRLEAVEPGTILRVRQAVSGTAEPVIVQGGETAVRIQIAPGVEVDATIIVTDAKGKAIPYPRLKTMVWYGSSGTGGGEPQTGGADGHIYLQHLSTDLKYTVYVEADGFGETSEELTLKPGKTAGAHIMLEEAATKLAGRVVDTDHQPVVGMPVAMDTGNFIHLHFTDAQGRFTFQVVGLRNQYWKILVRRDRGSNFGNSRIPSEEAAFESRFALGDREPVEFIMPKLGK